MTVAEAPAESATLRAFRERFERFVERFNAHDVERAARGLSADVEQHFPAGFTTEVLRGRDEWIKFFTDFFQVVPDWQMRGAYFEQLARDRFIVGIEYEGSGRTSGAGGNYGVWDIVELDEGGRVRRIYEYTDRQSAYEAVRTPLRREGE